MWVLEMTQTLQRIDYGHRHLGFLFFPAFSVDEHGMHVKGRIYPWSDVLEVSQTPPGMVFAAGWPLGRSKVTIAFKDGFRLCIDAESFCIRGERLKRHFVSGRSHALDDLISIVERRLGRRLIL